MRQSDLFAAVRSSAPPPPEVPDPDAIRVRLHALLETARAADAMPWPPTRTRTQEHLFHNMANWLPEEERDQLRHEFKAELERLRRGAPA